MYSIGRHQFVARKGKSMYKNSRNREVIGGWHIEVGRKGKLKKSKKGKVNICIIGDAVDSHGELKGESEIANYISEAKNIKEVKKRTSRVGGAWVLVVNIEGKILVTNDCCGLLPIYYCKKGGKKIIGSSISAIAKYTNEKKSKIFNRIKNSSDFFSAEKLTNGTWTANDEINDSSLPLSMTPYKNIRKLLPNKALRLDSFEEERIFPKNELPTKSVGVAAESIKDKMINIVKKIGSDSDSVRLPLTAGIDSRVLFAICKESNINYRSFTYVFEEVKNSGVTGTNGFGRDATVAKNICNKYEVGHDTIEMEKEVDLKNIVDMLKNVDFMVSSSTLPYEFKHLKEYLPQESTILNGSVSEIGRPLYGYGCLPSSLMSPSLLAEISGHRYLNRLRNMFKEWVKNAKKIRKEYGIRVMDLLYWEERMGSWQSSFQQQLRPITNVITPYNCRDVIRDFLSVPYEKRVKNEVHKKILEICDPHMLSYPINPIYGGYLLDRVKRSIKKYTKTLCRNSCILNYIWWKTKLMNKGVSKMN